MVDADFAGDLVSRRSSSDLYFFSESIVSKRLLRCRGLIGLSSGESEFYARVKGGATLLGMRSLMLDLGICPKLTLNFRMDSSAARVSQPGAVRGARDTSPLVSYGCKTKSAWES